jgi:farnesol dehydrogenase
MMTGATGFLGRSVAEHMAGEGYKVHVLYRSETKIRGWENPNIRFFRGTIGNIDSIKRAMKDCRHVIHMAALAAPWARDPAVFYRENVEGTVNVLESALRLGMERFVFTSTAGVLGPSGSGINSEDKHYQGTHFTHYDRSKELAERKVREFSRKGLETVTVSPTRVFGPGTLNAANSVTRVIHSYLQGRWRIIPGDGSSIGNYVYVDDVVRCHLQALEKGVPGERYLAGGENLSFNEFFETLARVSGLERKMVRMPSALMMAVAGLIQGTAVITGCTPPITPAFVRRNSHHWAVSSDKASRELDYFPLSMEEGLKKTIEWIRNKNLP